MHSDMTIEAIEWPKEINIRRARPTDATAIFIRKLFYNAGLLSSVVYILLKALLEPSIEAHYLQRKALSAATLLELRKTVSSLQSRLICTPVSAIGYNEKDQVIERSTQTSEDLGDLSIPWRVRWKRLNDKLQDVSMHLERYNKTCEAHPGNLEAFNFQMKLLVDELQFNDHPRKSSDTCDKIVKSVREVKGWFVNGRIP